MVQIDDRFVGSVRVLTFDALPSTNQAAFDLVQNEIETPFWVVTKEQVEGRGRRGRRWISAPGDLLTSICCDLESSINLACLPLAASLSLYEALTFCDPDLGQVLRLKWPNDLLIERKKISGILLESRRLGGLQRAVIGFGVNLAKPLDPSAIEQRSIERRATSLAEEGFSITAEMLLEALIRAQRRWFDRLFGGDHAVIRASWLAHAAGLGEQIEVRLARETKTGRFVDLAADGQLVLETKAGEIYHISAGDVFLAES